MKLDFKEISKAWYNKLIHSNELKKLADARFLICLECPSKKEMFHIKTTTWALKCGECGCPLKGKVYTPNTYLDKNGSCPLIKWKEVEDEYIKSFKTSKTII
jgi:ribosomal protein L37AE/L43A